MQSVSVEIEALYRERFVGLKRALATTTGDYASAEEALQEAFARALRSLDSYRGEAPVAAWIWSIACNVAREQRRTSIRRWRHRAQEADADGIPDCSLVEDGHDPRLVAALQRLPPRRRLIVFLRYFADCSYSEIASVCGLSEGTVAASLAQARAGLADALRTQDPDVVEVEECAG